MACADELMELDARLRELLTGSPRITLNGDRLVVATDAILFDGIDQEVADPDRPLVGTTWLFAGINSPLAAYAGTLVLAPDGILTFTGCQTVTGKHHVDGDRLTITLDAPSGEPCPDRLMAVSEQEVFAQLAGTFTVAITAGRMSIARDDGKSIHFNEA